MLRYSNGTDKNLLATALFFDKMKRDTLTVARSEKGQHAGQPRSSHC